jgi:peptidoglycan hydrolase-like protein with peptidoglycan-binding domain
MQTFSKKLAAVLVLGTFALPMMAFADTNASSTLSMDMQIKIQALLVQIRALQDQIKTLVGSSTGMGWNTGMGSSTGMGMPPGQMGKMTCITLNRNLREGDAGDDVKSVQQLLMDDSSSGFTGSATGFFGPLTAKAMMHFQMNNSIASSTDGSVGPLTRGFFNRRCGKGLDGMQGQGQNSGQGMMQGGAVRGTISANNTSSITLQTDGGSVVVNITASTTIQVFASTSTPPTTGTIADLVVGKKAMAMGQKNSDGSIRAVNIAVGDYIPMGMGGDNKGPGGDSHGANSMMPTGMMPTLNGSQHGPGPNGGPQNWY